MIRQISLFAGGGLDWITCLDRLRAGDDWPALKKVDRLQKLKILVRGKFEWRCGFFITGFWRCGLIACCCLVLLGICKVFIQIGFTSADCRCSGIFDNQVGHDALGLNRSP